MGLYIYRCVRVLIPCGSKHREERGLIGPAQSHAQITRGLIDHKHPSIRATAQLPLNKIRRVVVLRQPVGKNQLSSLCNGIPEPSKQVRFGLNQALEELGAVLS